MPVVKNVLTQQRLKELFTYNPCEGVFRRKASRGRCKAGTIAGWIDKSTGYICIELDKKKLYAHRLAHLWVYGKFPDNDTDHIDGDKQNNCFFNIRSATTSENLMNKKRQSNNSSGITGVSFDNRCNKFRGYIHVDQKYIHLGHFDEVSSAVAARKAAEEFYFGEFAYRQAA